MPKKIGLEFEGMDEVMSRISKLDGDVKSVAEKALKETHRYITPEVGLEIMKHNRTHRTEESIVQKPNINWSGDTAEVDVGFKISDGGLPSIFLMYGTQSHAISNQYGRTSGIHHGTDADKKLYNAILGNSTKKAIQELQAEIFFEEIRKLEK